jgi:hypothetical protein
MKQSATSVAYRAGSIIYLFSIQVVAVIDPLAVVISHCGWLMTPYGWLAG